jgi:2-polyprenyl-6-methoxyphenol hydroxylase-like FAD-dependent oxidoreductase
VQARTLELLDRLGVAQNAFERALPVTKFNVFSERKQIACFDFSHLDSPFPYTLMLPQNETEEILEKRLGELGGHVDRGVDLVGFNDRGDGVEATLRNAKGETELVTARWLVGCDGAHSAVRAQLGVQFLGNALEESFAVADLRVDWTLPYDELFAFLSRGNFTTFFPMRGGLHRVAIAYTGREAPTGDVTSEELQGAIDRCGPPGVRVTEIKASGRFRINQRAVDHQSKGRVFLAGDAAHVNSLVGAQGMNIGMQDAFNLGWKLALVASGRARESLLGTYSLEREGAVRRTVQGTARFTRLTLLHNPIAVLAREQIAPLILNRPKVRTTIEEALSQVDITYRQQNTASKKAGGLVAGDRAPDVSLRDPRTEKTTRLFELMGRDEYSLLLLGSPSGGARLGAEIRQVTRDFAGLVHEYVVLLVDTALDGEVPMRILCEAEGELRRKYGVRDEAMLLVRPDGYIGMRCERWDPGRLRAYLLDWLVPGQPAARTLQDQL